MAFLLGGSMAICLLIHACHGIQLTYKQASQVDPAVVPIGPEQYEVIIEVLKMMDFKDTLILRDYYPEQWELDAFDTKLGKEGITRTTFLFTGQLISDEYIDILRSKVNSILVASPLMTPRLAVILLTSPSVTSAILAHVRDSITYRLQHTFIVSSRVPRIDIEASIVEEMRTLSIRDHWHGGLLPGEELANPYLKHTYDILCNQCDPTAHGELVYTNRFDFKPKRGFVKLPVFRLRHEVFRNMYGRKFRTPVINRSPWFRFEQSENGTLTDIKGRDYDLLKLLAQSANFSFEAFVTPLTRIGDGNNTNLGIVGALARREPDYNFFIVDTTRSYFRNQACQFTSYGNFEDVGSWATPTPKVKESMNILSKNTPIPDVLMVAIMAVVGGIGFYIFNTLEAVLYKQKPWGLGFIAISSVGFVTGQSDVNKPFPRWHGTRVFVGLFLFYCYLIQQIISGNLYAFLTNPGLEPALKTTGALVNSMKAKQVELLVVQGGSFQGVIESAANIGPWAEIYAAMKEQPNGYTVRNAEEGLRNVTSSKGSFPQKAFPTSQKTMSFFYANTKRANGEKAAFYASPRNLLVGYKAIAMRWGAPYRDAFDKKLLQLQAGGILQKLEKDALEAKVDVVDDPIETQSIKRIVDFSRSAEVVEDDGAQRPFNLYRLSAPFYVLYAGLGLAGLAFAAEVVIHASRLRTLKNINDMLEVD